MWSNMYPIRVQASRENCLGWGKSVAPGADVVSRPTELTGGALHPHICHSRSNQRALEGNWKQSGLRAGRKQMKFASIDPKSSSAFSGYLRAIAFGLFGLLFMSVHPGNGTAGGHSGGYDQVTAPEVVWRAARDDAPTSSVRPAHSQVSVEVFRFAPRPGDEFYGSCGECTVSGMRGRYTGGTCKVCTHRE